MTFRRQCALSFVLLLLAAGIPATLAQDLLDPTCTVSAGGSIQAALDAADPGDKIVVCAGAYAEKLVVSTNSITLEGRPDTILDGLPFVGQRHAVTLGQGVSDFTLRGFEIRDYRDLLAEADRSGGVVARGNNRDIVIEENTIVESGFASVLLGTLGNSKWVIRNNTFASADYSHVLLLGAANVDVRDNLFSDAEHATLVAGAANVTLDNNEYFGSGNTAISGMHPAW